MKKLLTICLLLLGIGIQAQDFTAEAPNYKKIQKVIKKKKSNLYYPKLMERFKASDSTMTLEEKRHLYYGYIYTNTYKPYSVVAYKDSLRTALQEDLTEESLHAIVKFGDSILAVTPFDLRVIDSQLFAYKQMQNKEAYNKRMVQATILIDALLSSGDGTTMEKAIYVITVSDEYFLLDILGFEFGGEQALVGGHYDYLKVVENENKIEGLYFDVSASLNSLSSLFK